MSYITGPGKGSHDSWMVWTNEANYNTEMNPANFEYVNFEQALGRTDSSGSPPGNVATIGSRKILDAELTARQGLPVYVTLHSGPRRNTVPTGYVFGRLHQSKSSGSSSERNGTHVGPGGISSGKKSGGSTIKPTKFVGSRGEIRRSCPRGYELKRIGRRFMCVKR